MTGKTILIAGHGSKTKRNEAAVERQAELLRRKGYEVYHGFKGYSRPLLKNVMSEIADKGLNDVICVPMFMAGGHYIRKVIPKQIGLEAEALSGTVSIGGSDIDVRITPPIGTSHLLAYILADIAAAAEMKGRKRSIILLGNGSRDSDNSEMVTGNVGRLRERGLPAYSAFNSRGTPCLEDLLHDLSEDGTDDVVVIPMTIASDGHGDGNIPSKLGLEQNGSGMVTVNGKRMHTVYAPPVGTHDDISEIIEDLIRPYI